MRISTTTIEAFRLFRDPDQEWMTEDELVATIRGEFVPNAKTILGHAFDAVLNEPDQHRVEGGYQAGPHFFPDLMMAPALALFDRRGVFQVKSTKQYLEGEVVAVADELVGLQLIENKTTTGSFDFEKYAHSCQWRFMVDIFQPAVVTYRVFLLSDPEQGAISLRSIETFNLFPYPELTYDCARLVRDFAAYVRRKGLDGLLREKQRLAAAG